MTERDTSLGRLLKASLEPPWQKDERVRDVMPLPLWPDVASEIQKVLDEKKFRDEPGDWRGRGETKAKAGKALRHQGLLLWHGLVVLSLNWLHCGGVLERGVSVKGGKATKAQEAALERLWSMVKVFSDEKEERKGVPRTPTFDWPRVILDLSISYTGEVVKKAATLTLEQVLPGLPSRDHGGLVDILEVVDAKMGEKLKHPKRMIREEILEPLPKPKVMCDDGEWEKIVGALWDRNLIRPVDSYPVVSGERVLNGAFGVEKPGKQTDSGLPVLRLIIDLRATNCIMDQLDGDLQTLTGAASFQKLAVEEGQQLLISGDDLTSAFYLFRLPEEWSKFMVLEKPVKKSLFEEGKSGLTYVGLTVLPMGWSSAVAVMQSAHRQIALRNEMNGGAGLNPFKEIRKDGLFPDLEETPAWTIYLDDTTIIEKVADAAAQTLEGLVPIEQDRLRRAYEWWGIPTNKGKALERSRSAERLGAVLDGESKTLRRSTRRCLELCSLGCWIRSQDEVSKKALQVYAGKAVHLLQFRRCMFSVLQDVFVEISKDEVDHCLPLSVVNEMLVLESSLPTLVCNLGAVIDPVVTASDACESGGGACYANRLSPMGELEVLELMAGEREDVPEKPADFREVEEKIVVIDLFAGIGGLERSLARAGVHPVYTLAIEKDTNCRRLLRRTYPGIELISDIRSVTKEVIQKAVRKVAGVNGVIVGGGSPCQGISQLSSERTHFDDERSVLFYEGVRVLDITKEVATEEGIWILKYNENVVPDAGDIREMSSKLGMFPNLIDSGFFSWARRRRLYWVSVPLLDVPGVDVIQKGDYDVRNYEAECENMENVLRPGYRWEAGERNPKLRFPTFTRAIPRTRPPPRPAGLGQTNEAAKKRWQEDSYRFPPYTYDERFMITTPRGQLRRLTADEREVLMGYPPGYTTSLAKKMEPPVGKTAVMALEDLRCRALGNSFHTGAVAVLLDHALWSLGVKALKGHHAIMEEWHVELTRLRENNVSPHVLAATQMMRMLCHREVISPRQQTCHWKTVSKKM